MPDDVFSLERNPRRVFRDPKPTRLIVELKQMKFLGFAGKTEVAEPRDRERVAAHKTVRRRSRPTGFGRQTSDTVTEPINLAGKRHFLDLETMTVGMFDINRDAF